MPEKRQRKGSLLVIIGSALLIITVLVLFTLRRSPRPAAELTDSAQTSAGPSAVSSSGLTSLPSSAPPRRTTPVWEEAARPALPATSADAGAPARPGPEGAPPATAHVSAPAAPPAELQRETDPAKREQLMKMHRLSTARVRTSLLRRRIGMLRFSTEQAKKTGAWPPDRVRQSERDLVELEDALKTAEDNLQRIRTEVGGDIDR